MKRRSLSCLEPALSILDADAELATASGSNDQVGAPIPIEVGPAQARSQLRQSMRQGRLTAEIIKGLILVTVSEACGLVFKPRCGRLHGRNRLGPR